MTHDLVDQLSSLHTAAVDARAGYEKALQDAHAREDLTGLFRRMASLHHTNADDLAAILAGLGQKAGDDASFMSSIHRAIMDVRGLFGGLGESVLPGLIDGEERNLRHWDEVIGAAGATGEIAAALYRQREGIAQAVAAMKAEKAGS